MIVPHVIFENMNGSDGRHKHSFIEHLEKVARRWNGMNKLSNPIQETAYRVSFKK